jgi:hypothetical protein
MLLALCLAAVHAWAQWPGSIPPGSSPDLVLRRLILQLQTGQVDPTFFGHQLLQTIFTNSTGVDPALVQLGNVVTVEVVESLPGPNGTAYLMKAQHTHGVSNWLLVVSTLTMKVEHASVGINAPPPELAQSMPQPQPQPQPIAQPRPVPAPAGPTRSFLEEACRRHPNMCP